MIELPKKVQWVKSYLSELNPASKIRGVYFLCMSNKVLYIGQSNNIVKRVGAHLEDKVFTKIFVLSLNYVGKNMLNNIEHFLIWHINPKLNKYRDWKYKNLFIQKHLKRILRVENKKRYWEPYVGNQEDTIRRRYRELMWESETKGLNQAVKIAISDFKIEMDQLALKLKTIAKKANKRYTYEEFSFKDELEEIADIDFKKKLETTWVL